MNTNQKKTALFGALAMLMFAVACVGYVHEKPFTYMFAVVATFVFAGTAGDYSARRN